MTVDAAAATLTLDRMAAAGAYNAWLLERARPHVGRRVLDAGAGIGTFTDLLAQEGLDVVAAEPDPAYAPVLRDRFAGRANVRIVTGEAGAVADGDFDSVLCFNVLEHIRDDVDALRQFRERLREGGRLLLLVPAHPALFGGIDRSVGHERRYRKASLRAALEQAGLSVERLRYVNPVGAAGWLVASRLARAKTVPGAPLRLYDRLVPLFRVLDRVELPFGLSLWAVARR